MAEHASTRSERQWLLWLIGVFAVSRVIYYALGVRFLWFGFWHGPHSLDIELLRHDLARSLWYLHTQPPLFNAFAGMVLKVNDSLGIDPGVTFTATYTALGVALAVVLFLLMRELRVPAPFAFAVTSVFMLNPATVLYENWILYTYPVAVFLCASGLFFARYVRAHRSVDAALFGFAIALLAMTRASYHLVFVLAAVGGLIVASGVGARRRALVACAVPLLLVVGLYAKNLVVFGSPSASSWTGFNLGRIVFGFSNEGLVRREMKSGAIWRYSLQPPFQAISVYTNRRPDTGIPALDDIYKSTGEPNLNNRESVAISNRYLSSALSFIRSHPLVYARLVGYSFQIAAVPAEDNPFLAANRDAVDDLAGLYRLVLLQPRDADVRHAYFTRTSVSALVPSADQFAWGVVLQYLAVFAVGPVLLVRILRRRAARDPVRRATLVYLSAVTIYGVTVSNLFELAENQRFRFETDPVVCAAAAALAMSAWLYLRRGHRSAGEHEFGEFRQGDNVGIRRDRIPPRGRRVDPPWTEDQRP